MLYGLWCTTVSVSSKYACVHSLLSLSPSPQGGDFTWQRWDHPAEDGEPCECPALLLRSLTLSNPVLHGMPTSLVHGQSCLAPGSHKSCHSRGSQGYCLPHLRFGFYFSSWGTWEADFGCSERGVYSNHFLSVLWTHPMLGQTSNLWGTCSVSANSRGLWLNLQMSHKNALACWSKCSYKFRLEW